MDQVKLGYTLVNGVECKETHISATDIKAYSAHSGSGTKNKDIVISAMEIAGITPTEESVEYQANNLRANLIEAFGGRDGNDMLDSFLRELSKERSNQPEQGKAAATTAEIRMDEEGFKTPTRSVKRKIEMTQEATKLPLMNSFSSLSEVDLTEPDPTEQYQPTQPRKRRIPPLMVKKPADAMDFAEKIRQRFGEEVKSTLSGDYLKVLPTDADTYRALRHEMDKAGIQYNTYLLPEDKPFKVVIKGLPTGLTLEERQVNTDRLKKSLADQGIATSNVAPMRSFRNKEWLPMYLVEVPKKPKDAKSIFNVKTCCGIDVHISKHRRRRGVGQCYRCQKYFHSSICCTATPRCVKCGQEHLSKECLKKLEEKPKCANCLGEHTANFRGCPMFPKTSQENQRLGQAIRPAARRIPPPAQENYDNEFPRMLSTNHRNLNTEHQQPTRTSYAEKLKDSNQLTQNQSSPTSGVKNIIITILSTVSEILQSPTLQPGLKDCAKRLLSQAMELMGKV